ncbi:MAG TPA: DUF998 domain-containing protein [Candidatus Saccharibacteria bacterium]|nr:DUF998 domain-containing protein [Candidatus Saccharibacteria bacterium]
MNHPTLTNWLCLSGVVAFVLYITATLVAPLYYPGYNWVTQAISDLGALSSPSRLAWLIIWSFGSACALLSVAVVSIVFQQKANRLLRIGIYLFASMTWLLLGYTMFPLSEGGSAGTAIDALHLYLVTPLVMLTTLASLICIVMGARKEPRYRSLTVTAAVVLSLVLIGGAGIGLAGETHFGLFERVTIYSIMAFTAILGVFGFREKQTLSN